MIYKQNNVQVYLQCMYNRKYFRVRELKVSFLKIKVYVVDVTVQRTNKPLEIFSETVMIMHPLLDCVIFTHWKSVNYDYFSSKDVDGI